MVKCKTCESKCCRYFGLQLDTPRSKEEFENLRWFLAHKGVTVFVEKKKWYLQMDNKCRFLQESNQCGIYDKRPLICREHSPGTCENAMGNFDHEYTFKSLKEIDAYLAKRFSRKRERGKEARSKEIIKCYHGRR